MIEKEKLDDMSFERTMETCGIRWGIGSLIGKPDIGWARVPDIADDEKIKLRPIAETLAMLEGNAFFGMEAKSGTPHWYYYLPQAKALYEDNGGDTGWAARASFGPNPA